MGKHITSVATIKQENSTTAASIALTDFVDQLSAPGASFSVLTSSPFPSLTDFSAAAMADALKWTDLEQIVVYQMVSPHTVHRSFCLSRKLMDLASVYGHVVC